MDPPHPNGTEFGSDYKLFLLKKMFLSRVQYNVRSIINNITYICYDNMKYTILLYNFCKMLLNKVVSS